MHTLDSMPLCEALVTRRRRVWPFVLIRWRCGILQCVPSDPDNYAYYDRDEAKEMGQCGFTWNWEMSEEWVGCFRGNGMIRVYFLMNGVPSVKGLKRFLSELVYFYSNWLPLKQNSLGHSLTAFSYVRVRYDNDYFLSPLKSPSVEWSSPISRMPIEWWAKWSQHRQRSKHESHSWSIQQHEFIWFLQGSLLVVWHQIWTRLQHSKHIAIISNHPTIHITQYSIT